MVSPSDASLVERCCVLKPKRGWSHDPSPVFPRQVRVFNVWCEFPWKSGRSIIGPWANTSTINSYGLEPDEPHLRNSAIMCHVQIRETGSIKGNQLGMVQTPMEELRYPKSHQVVAPCQVQHQVGSIRASQTRHLMILMVPKSWTHQNSASSASVRIMVKWSIFQIRLEYLYNHLTIQRLFQ